MPFVLTLSYRARREHRRRSGQAVVGDPPVDRLCHAFGVAMPGSDHIGGDTRRAHPGDIRVPQLAERDCLEPCRLISERRVHRRVEHACQDRDVVERLEAEHRVLDGVSAVGLDH